MGLGLPVVQWYSAGLTCRRPFVYSHVANKIQKCEAFHATFVIHVEFLLVCISS